MRRGSELYPVHEHVVADQQRVLHRTGGDFKSLQDKSDDKQTRYQYGRQRRQKLDRGLARLFFRLFFLSFFFGQWIFLDQGGVPPLFDDSKCAIPAGHLKQMGRSISEMIKFITRCG